MDYNLFTLTLIRDSILYRTNTMDELNITDKQSDILIKRLENYAKKIDEKINKIKLKKLQKSSK